MAITSNTRGRSKERASAWAFLHQREFRQVVYQIVIVVALAALLWMVVGNTIQNLRKQNIASGFGFWDTTAGFDISQTLITYSATSTYGRAFWVGLYNTLLVSGLGIIFATMVGFTVGIARLSSNWLIARLATVYIEIARNVPLLLQLFVWYFAVLKNLPDVFTTNSAGQRVSGSVEVLGIGLLNTRGLFLPKPNFLPGIELVIGAFILAIVASVAIAWWSVRRQLRTGQRFPVGWAALALVVLLPLIAFYATGQPLALEYPTVGRFNLQGGVAVLPEFMALLLGLVFYTGAFIAEIVRAGIQGVSKGQKEAARALGLTSGQMLKLVVVPQAMRIIIPPLTSNYLNLTKNSSLGVAIAYPDLVSVFAGTVLNQTGQAVEVILVTMLVYLTLSLLTSAFMNWFNARMKLVER